jgi:hypothetical protein
MARSQAARLGGVGDSRRILWMIGSHGRKTHPLRGEVEKWKTGF